MKRTQEEITQIYEKYYEMVWRICFMQLGNVHDAYDGTQETFLRLMSYRKSFHSEEHQKAWLIRTAVNYCKDVMKSGWKRSQIGMEENDFSELFDSNGEGEKHEEVVQAMMDLPEKYRVILYLYYYEGYSLKEISGMVKVNPSTLRSRFAKAKQLMKQYLI